MFINFSKVVYRRNAVFALLFCSALMMLSILLIPETMPSPSSAEAGVVPTPSLTFSGSHSLSLTVNPGQFGTSDTRNLVVETTNYSGYTMTIAPSTGNSTDLVNSADSNVTLPTITSNTITASSFNYLSTAAYALSTDNGANYKKVTNGGQLYTTNAATDSTTGGMTLKLGAKAISSTPSGDYTKAFTLTATANAALYNIIFDANAGEDTVTNMPTGAQLSGADVILPFEPAPTRAGFRFLGWDTNQNATQPTYTSSGTTSFPIDPEQDATVNTKTLYAIWGCGQVCYHDNGADAGEMPDQTISNATTASSYGGGLLASNFSRAGYGFAGWSEDKNAYTHLTDNDQNNDPTIFGPSQIITVAQAGDGLDLYAVWVPAAKDGNNNPIYLQGWTGCSTLKDREVVALTDNRDGSVYAVTRIEKVENDVTTYEKCWIIENLRLDVATATITSTNTDHPTAAFRQEASALSSAFWDTCTSNNSACLDHISYSLANIDRNNIASYDTNDRTSSWYAYGSSYNLYTATAGHGTYNKSSGDTDGSLCPSGWSLPSGKDATGDYGKLDIALGGTGAYQYSVAASNRWRTYPVNFLYSGGLNGSSAYDRGAYGYYWSSTVRNSSSAYVESLSSTNVSPDTYGSRYCGRSVRCLSEGNAEALERFTVVYSANGGDETSVPQSQTSATDANDIYTFTISNIVPTRSGFTFAGWIDEEGNEASAGGTYTAYNTSTTLYARWANSTCNSHATTIGTGNSTDAVCLQDMNATVKASMPIADSTNGTYTLIDARDNKSYTVAKLDDGNVWMTQNLKLGAEADANTGDTGNRLITSYDSDLAPSSVFIVPASTTSFETSNDVAAYTTPKFYLDSTNGAYYSFATAIADTTSYTTASQNLTTSICPSGWDLPNQNQYNTLKTAANLTSSNAYSAPYSFQKVGYKNGTSAPTSTSSVYVWTATNNSASNAYYSSGTANSTTMNYDKRFGIPIRCIASNGTASIKYYKNDGTSDFIMQNNVNINSDKLYPSSTFSRGDAYAFKGWDTAAAGNGTRYAFSADLSTIGITDGQTLELYAVWNPNLKVVYHANYGDSTSTSVQWIEAGASASLGGYNKFTRSGYKIARWDTDPYGEGTSYATSSSYTAPANTQAGDELPLYAIWEQINTVIYNANGGRCEATGNITDTCMQKVKHTNVVTGDTFDLFASNYSRSGYGFVGWSTDPNAQPGGSSTIYGPNETITATSDFIAAADANRNITLYAIWVASSGNLQNFSCSSLTNIGDVTALIDTRDNQVYAVAKLKDGNCWMIENLRLESANSSDSSKAQGFGGVFTGLAAAETANFSNSTTANTIYSTTIITGSNQGYRFPRYNNSNTSSRAGDPSATNNVTTAVSHTNLNAAIYSYGNYYTWAATIADTQEHSNIVYSTSICPIGWHIPYGSNDTGVNGGKTSGGFAYLDTQLESPDGSHGTGENQYTFEASQRWRTYPNNFLYAGNYNGSNVNGRGSSSYYWSSKASSSSNAYYFSSSNTSPKPGTTSIGKFNGVPVRCVASNSYNLTVSYGTGVATVLVDNNLVGDGQSITLAEGTKHTIDMTLNSGYGFISWTVSDAVLASASTQSTIFTMGNRNATLTANSKLISYNVVYNANGGDCGNNTTTCMQRVKHINVEIGDTFDLFASNYSRADYGFAGWSTDPNATVNSSSTIYGPNETIEATASFIANADADKKVTLYAVWVPKDTTYTLQTFAANNRCDTMSANQVIALGDARDSNVYTVGKLADGNCWMMENLRLDTAGTQGSAKEALSQGYGGVFTGLADPETTNFSTSTTANTLSGTTLYSLSIITGSSQSFRFPRYNNYNTANPGTTNYRATDPSVTDSVSSANSHTNLNASIYSYGNYYTWAAAIADTDFYDTSNQVINTTSLCPTGWHLPYGNSNTTVNGGNTKGGFYYLRSQLSATAMSTDSSQKLRKYPNNLVYSGYYNGSSANSRGNTNYHWTSTVSSSSYAYTYGVASTSVSDTTAYKHTGRPIRCVSDAVDSNSSNNNSNNNNSQQNSPQQQSVEPQASPQATPSAAPAAQSMSFSAPATVEPTNIESANAEDQTEENEDSEATSTAPLGVRRSSTESDSSISSGTAVVKPGTVSDSDIFGTIAVVSAGVVAITGALILADKKRDDEEEEEGKTGEGKST